MEYNVSLKNKITNQIDKISTPSIDNTEIYRDSSIDICKECESKNSSGFKNQFNIEYLKKLKISNINSLKDRRTIIAKILKNEDKFSNKDHQESIRVLKILCCK